MLLTRERIYRVFLLEILKDLRCGRLKSNEKDLTLYYNEKDLTLYYMFVTLYVRSLQSY